MNLYEVEFKNRVVKKLSRVPIRGQQGRWFSERCLITAHGRREISNLILEKLKSRRISGKTRWRQRKVEREIKITEIRRLA